MEHGWNVMPSFLRRKCCTRGTEWRACGCVWHARSLRRACSGSRGTQRRACRSFRTCVALGFASPHARRRLRACHTSGCRFGPPLCLGVPCFRLRKHVVCRQPWRSRRRSRHASEDGSVAPPAGGARHWNHMRRGSSSHARRRRSVPRRGAGVVPCFRLRKHVASRQPRRRRRRSRHASEDGSVAPTERDIGTT